MRRVVALLVVVALLAGCWSRREITETAFAGLMAVDWVDGQYQVTMNMALPVGAPGGPGGAVGEAAAKPIWTVRASGETLDEAVGRISRLSPRRLYLAHVRATLFGEAMARRGIGPALEYLVRAVEIRPTMWVGVTPGLAGRLLMARPALESYPANGPLGYHDQAQRRGSESPSEQLATVVANLTEEGIDLALPTFRLAERGDNPTAVPTQQNPGAEVLMGGAAVFRGDRLVAILDPEIARGVLWGRGRAGLGAVVAPCPEGENKAVFRIRDNETMTQVRRQGSGAVARMHIVVVADLNEVQCREGPRTPEQVKPFEAALAGAVRREVEAALAVSRESGSDFIGFGQTLFRRAPADFRALEPRWREVLARLPVEIEIKVNLPRVGQKYGILGLQPDGRRETESGGP